MIYPKFKKKRVLNQTFHIIDHRLRGFTSYRSFVSVFTYQPRNVHRIGVFRWRM